MREGLLEVVETVSDCNIFHNVALVKDIGTSWRDNDVDLIFWRNREVFTSVDRDEFATLFRCEGLVTHFLEKSDDFGSREVETSAGVDVGSASVERAREKGRREHLSGSTGATLFVNNLDRFDAVKRFSSNEFTPSQ